MSRLDYEGTYNAGVIVTSADGSVNALSLMKTEDEVLMVHGLTELHSFSPSWYPRVLSDFLCHPNAPRDRKMSLRSW